MRAAFGWALVLCALTLGACDEDVVCVDCGGLSPYLEPTSPENLIENLQTSYRRREIEEYAKILAPEFIFKFQPIDANEIEKEFWTRDEDSAATYALFSSPEVSEIRISLTYTSRDTINFQGTPADTVRIRISPVDLQIDQTDGITWLVTDQQDMFFRKGLPENGENPQHWWLYEWDDLPTLQKGFTDVDLTTWGRLKARYGPSS